MLRSSTNILTDIQELCVTYRPFYSLKQGNGRKPIVSEGSMKLMRYTRQSLHDWVHQVSQASSDLTKVGAPSRGRSHVRKTFHQEALKKKLVKR